MDFDLDDFFDLCTDWCVRCGAEHDYMSGPCEKCGGQIFTKENPTIDTDQ